MPVYTIESGDGKRIQQVEVPGTGIFVEQRLLSEGEKITAIDGMPVRNQ